MSDHLRTTGRFMAVVASALCVGACAPQSKGMFDFNPDECEPVSLPASCSNAPHISVNKNSLNANPKNYCTPTNATVKIKISPANLGLNSVETVPKDDVTAWLYGKNDSDQQWIELTVPGNPLVKNDYFVVFADGSCIDPRITVRDDVRMMQTEQPAPEPN